MTRAIGVRDLHLGDRSARLKQINLEIRQGEYFGLVGMNGAGKTSLIKCLLDFCHPEQGEVTLLGQPARTVQARRPLAYLPERFKAAGHLTGEQFLKRMMALFQVPYQRDDALALLSSLALDTRALTLPLRQHSKGMTQQIGLIACLLSGRELLILDEPMSGLDPHARAKLKEILQSRRHCRVPPPTLVMSSHLLTDVETLCDRIAILHRGELQFVGSTAECMERFAADTLEQAYMNCLSGL